MRGFWGGFRTPPPPRPFWKSHKNIGFLNNSGPDRLKKLASIQFWAIIGPARETPFHWRVLEGPLLVVFWSYLPSTAYISVVSVGPLWQNFLDPRIEDLTHVIPCYWIYKLETRVNCEAMTGELRLSGNHTVTEYDMSGEPYSQKSGWISHSNEWIFQVMAFNKYSLSCITCNGQCCLVLNRWLGAHCSGGSRAPPRYLISYENEIIWSQWDQIILFSWDI